jgi:hypothetical protein
MRLSLKELLNDLKKVTNKSNSFGVIMNITQNGKTLTKNVRENGTFFEIPLYPPFNDNLKYPKGDLHLSVFEDSGIITKHVAFKTKIRGRVISYYYGKKYKLDQNGVPDFEDYTPKPWTTPHGLLMPDDIKLALVNLYNNIKPHIKVQRELESGQLSAPKTLPTWGEGSSRPVLSNQQKFLARKFYEDYGELPPSPLRKVLSEENRNHGVTPIRLFR